MAKRIEVAFTVDDIVDGFDSMDDYVDALITHMEQLPGVVGPNVLVFPEND